jgi:6-phosphogluconolactonase
MVSVYASVGAELIRFSLDVDAAELRPTGSIRISGRVQYAWPHASLPVLYVSSANREPEFIGGRFFVSAVNTEVPGDLREHGAPVAVPARPIHNTTDVTARHLLTAYDEAPGLTVHQLRSDGAIGASVGISKPFDYGVYPHQVRVAPSNQSAILVARGHSGRFGPLATRGALKILSYHDGTVANRFTVDLAGCRDVEAFNPRHLDFHPNLPLVFVTLEPQNRLVVLRFHEAAAPAELLSVTTVLADSSHVWPRQLAGAVHVHPNGRTVYVANRADIPWGGPGWITPAEWPLSDGGENNIAVFSLDETGRPRLLQHVDTRGVTPRTFAVDPSGRILVAANLQPAMVRTGSVIEKLPASLTVFRIRDDGSLGYARTYDVDVGGETLWWMGMA